MMNRSMGMGMNQSAMGGGGSNMSAMNRSMGPAGQQQQQGGMMMGGMNQSAMGGGMGAGRPMYNNGGVPMPGQQHASVNMIGMNNQAMQQSMMQGGGWGQQQPGMFGPNCCGPTMPGMPIDTYICGNEQAPANNPLNPLETTCDCATIATFFFSLLSIIAFAVVMAVNDPDRIFNIYDGMMANTIDLEARMIEDVPYLWALRNASDNRTDQLGARMYTVTAAPATTTVIGSGATTTATVTTTTTTVTVPNLVSRETLPTAAGGEEISLTSAADNNTAISDNQTIAQTDNTTDDANSTTDATTAIPVVKRAFVAMDTVPYNVSWDTTVNHSNVSPDPVWTQTCTTRRGLTGTWGKLCVEQSLNAATFYVQLHTWTLFRNTLYFIAMVGSILTLLLLYLIHRFKNPPFGSPQAMGMQQQQQPQQNQYGMEPPITFAGTNLYLVFRAGWGMVSVVIFLWVCTQMYHFWSVIGDYKSMTTGNLHDFFVDYENKFVASVVCITLYLCWPLTHLCLEIALFFAFFIPYYAFRTMCKPGIENIRYPIETPLDDIPGWVRIDMFFSDFNQFKRLGFSVPMWNLITGSYQQYFEGCEQPNPNLVVLDPPCGLPNNNNNTNGGNHMDQSTALNKTMPPQSSNSLMMSPAALASSGRGVNMQLSGMRDTLPPSNNEMQTLSPSKKDKRHRDTTRDGGDKKEKSRDRSHHRSSSVGLDVSGYASGAMDHTEAEATDGGDTKKRDKREKRDKTDKKDKHRSRSAGGDDRKEKKEKSKSKKEKRDKDSGVYPVDD